MSGILAAKKIAKSFKKPELAEVLERLGKSKSGIKTQLYVSGMPIAHSVMHALVMRNVKIPRHPPMGAFSGAEAQPQPAADRSSERRRQP